MKIHEDFFEIMSFSQHRKLAETLYKIVSFHIQTVWNPHFLPRIQKDQCNLKKCMNLLNLIH